MRTMCKKCSASIPDASAQESIFRCVHLKDPDGASILQRLTPYFDKKNAKDRYYR